MPMTIRFATADDAAAIAAIYAPLVLHTTISFEETPPSPDVIAGRIQAGGRLHPWLAAVITPGTTAAAAAVITPGTTAAAAADDADAAAADAQADARPGSTRPHLAAYAAASAFRSRAAYRWCVETSVYVAESQRRSGAGSRLYRALLDVLAAQGYRRAVAGISRPNDASEAFHRRQGFEFVGASRGIGWKHGRWIDVAWWQRDLGPADDAEASAGSAPSGSPRPATEHDLVSATLRDDAGPSPSLGPGPDDPRLTCDA